MTRTARVALYGNAVYVYLEDPSIPSSLLGPKGNFVQGVYDQHSSRIRYEAAIRGYGDDAQQILNRLLSIADRIAMSRSVGVAPGPRSETVIGTVPFT
jgi:hypothetical protein